ncbi:MAG: hypothetical protein MUF15_01295 [Acidobacteria bacterium]|nr:hypothetical protein [Acidobacteriota bacterium]
MKRMAFLVSGNGWLFEQTIQACKQALLDVSVCLLITDKMAAPCIGKAQASGIDYHYVETLRREPGEYSQEILDVLNIYRIDIAVSMFDRILAGNLLTVYRERFINLHLSLLPNFAGLAPRRQALTYGVRFTGATLHFIDEQIDGGPIIAQAVFPISPATGKDDLYREYGKILPGFLLNALDYIVRDAYHISGRKVILKGASYDSLQFSPAIQEKFQGFGGLYGTNIFKQP